MELCEHLKPILVNELARGNAVREVHENAWTNTILDVELERAIEIDQANSLISNIKSVRYFENNDNHYELQKGYFCEMCKHSLAGPK